MKETSNSSSFFYSFLLLLMCVFGYRKSTEIAWSFCYNDHGDHMEYYGYALQSGFASFLTTYPDLLLHIKELSLEQQHYMIQSIDETELWERAVHYFNNEHIYLENHRIYYENTWKKTVYTMKIDANAIILTQYEDNPFLPFLKRIFRNFFIYEQKEQM